MAQILGFVCSSVSAMVAMAAMAASVAGANVVTAFQLEELLVAVVRLIAPGVSPLRGAGLLRCASSRCQRPSVSPLRAAIPHAGSPPPSALVGAQGVAGLRPVALPGRSRMRRSRLRLHRDADSQVRPALPCVDHDSGPFPCPGIAGLGSFTLRENDARLTN